MTGQVACYRTNRPPREPRDVSAARWLAIRRPAAPARRDRCRCSSRTGRTRPLSLGHPFLWNPERPWATPPGARFTAVLGVRPIVGALFAGAVAALVLLGVACGSAADPGEIPYFAPAKTDPTATATATATAVVDSGANTPLFAAPYEAGMATLTSNQPGHTTSVIGNPNPAGHSCVNECHSMGGVAATEPFSAGGTVYTDQTGATPVEAGVEVRIKNPNGQAFSAYTDENGNFFIRATDFQIEAGANPGIRDAVNPPMTMVTTLAAGTNGGACGNGTGCHAKGGLGGLLRVKN